MEEFQGTTSIRRWDLARVIEEQGHLWVIPDHTVLQLPGDRPVIFPPVAAIIPLKSPFCRHYTISWTPALYLLFLLLSISRYVHLHMDKDTPAWKAQVHQMGNKMNRVRFCRTHYHHHQLSDIVTDKYGDSTHVN